MKIASSFRGASKDRPDSVVAKRWAKWELNIGVVGVNGPHGSTCSFFRKKSRGKSYSFDRIQFRRPESIQSFGKAVLPAKRKDQYNIANVKNNNNLHQRISVESFWFDCFASSIQSFGKAVLPAKRKDQYNIANVKNNNNLHQRISVESFWFDLFRIVHKIRGDNGTSPRFTKRLVRPTAITFIQRLKEADRKESSRVSTYAPKPCRPILHFPVRQLPTAQSCACNWTPFLLSQEITSWITILNFTCLFKLVSYWISSGLNPTGKRRNRKV